MDLKVIHDTIRYYVNKDQQAFISPAEIDLVLDKAQLVLFNKYHHNPLQPKQARVSEYGYTQRVDDSLSPFKDKYTFTTSNTASGIISLPANYLHLISLYTTQYNNQLQRNIYSAVQVLNEEELIERLNSQIIPVSAEDPIAIMNKENKIQLFPEVPANGGVYYFRRPVAPVYVYAQSGRVITYNQAGSTQMEWKDFDYGNIISIALSYYGINMSSQEVMAFAQSKQMEGQ